MPDSVTVLMIGDIVGEPGLSSLERLLPGIIERFGADFVTANGENSALFGMTEKDALRILAAGVDVITSGNHVWENRRFWPFMDGEQRMLRPANYPSPAAGRGFVMVEKKGRRFVVINLQGREYMTPIDCPFRAFDGIIETCRETPEEPPPVVIVDFHAESTREKEALGFYADGRAAVFAGTHTHVQTADEKILPKGAAYISDLGMTGAGGGIIGMDKDICLERARKQIAYPMRCAEGPAAVQGICVRLSPYGGPPKVLVLERFSVSAPCEHPER
ncbi:MAG: YmdB family metallophosphoesterase [Spirochaetaceae bacterium]|jgi:metallophosphoesterase (TIGR00282 family)|nr:YmdB family metallophosphoesterase [Spirochaetaceae bacterium]